MGPSWRSYVAGEARTRGFASLALASFAFIEHMNELSFPQHKQVAGTTNRQDFPLEDHCPCDKGKSGESPRRKAMGPRLLRDAFCDAVKDPKIARLPPYSSLNGAMK